MGLVYWFDTNADPGLSEIGGKGMSLLRLTREGFPVPPGFVLPVAFFRPWIDGIKGLPEWGQLVSSTVGERKPYFVALNQACQDLHLEGERQRVLAEALDRLMEEAGDSLLAVRSSSPEEDLEGASFAGGYETTLGVRKETIEAALRRSFASCLAERVFAYKEEHGFPVDNPRIAVVVQVQIPSEMAGVAFSLNPLNNCYDEVVINANYGLGESVVAGIASPDTVVVDKVDWRILQKTVGRKETAVWLDQGGGTYEKPAPDRTELCLSDSELLTLARLTGEVEKYFGLPVDIEWAFAGGRLYLLQARPITAYIPLPEAMQTAPGQPKLLYLDETLAKQGIVTPLSWMGTDFLSSYNSKTMRVMTGRDISGVVDGTGGFYQGRMYLNISNHIRLSGKKKILNTYRAIDIPSSEIIAAIDEAEYVPKELPPKLRGAVWGIIKNSLGLGRLIIRAMRNPVIYEKEFQAKAAQFRVNLQNDWEQGLSVTEFAGRIIDRFVEIFQVSLPMIIVAELSRSGMRKLCQTESPELQSRLTYLEKALPNNVTVEMGLSLYRLSRFAAIQECRSFGEFARQLEARSLSGDFLTAWDSFQVKYGFRCPKELDIATPRFSEQPEMLFKQLKAMAESASEDNNPQVSFERARVEREKDYRELLRAVGKRGKGKASKFAQHYRRVVIFSGYREAPKYYFLMALAMLRQKVWMAAVDLVSAGRLDAVDQVFDLTIDDLGRALADPALDLRPLIDRNTAFLRRIARIRNFPRVIDSRGRIIPPPRKQDREGELAGEPISPGTVRGRVKVLSSPDEKPVLPGEILVVRAADPGWTPLFSNASGIILEIGGMFQHGALVAREYGKPCVAGIEGAVTLLRDGQMVELDGLCGVVRLLT